MSPADEARARAAPSAEQRAKMERVARAVTEAVQKAAKEHGALEVSLGGSFAKDTWLAEGADIDVFVLFKADVSKERLREKAKALGFAALEGHGPYTRYAEHPFVEATVDGVKVNVVPCYDVPAGMWKSAADRSRFHTAYMKEGLDGGRRADARVLKKFLKANGVYGAEIARQGFSGYVAEVLVMEMGSFEGVLERFAGIGRGEAIGRSEKKFETPVSIADPVDGGRNLAAAISEENMARFVMAARAYLEGPSGEFFQDAGPVRPRALGQVAAVGFGYSSRSPETIWGQAKRAASQVARQMSEAGFSVARHAAAVYGERVVLAFMLESQRLPPMRTREGPDAFCRADCEKFVRERMPGAEIMWVGRDGRLYAMEKREVREAGDFLAGLMGREGSGIPAGLAGDVAAGFEVWAGERIPESARSALAELFAPVDGRLFDAR